MDFAGPFVRSGEGQWDMVLIVVDKFTKRSHFIPSKQTDTAEDTARRFFDEVIRLHGLPSVIVSDRDAKFTSRFWQSLFDRFGTKLAMSSAYHPQTDGQSERMVRTLKEMLRSAVDHRQHDWTHHLAELKFAYNNSHMRPHSSLHSSSIPGIIPRFPIHSFFTIHRHP
jgi:transposase InsO family protein